MACFFFFEEVKVGARAAGPHTRILSLPQPSPPRQKQNTKKMSSSKHAMLLSGLTARLLKEPGMGKATPFVVFVR
jgi:hypothetical protein